MSTIQPLDASLLPPEVIPDVDSLVTEDGKPVDNIFAERQHRLLVDSLYASFRPEGARPFAAFTNVGLFYSPTHPPLAPDLMLSFDVSPQQLGDVQKYRSYFVWLFDKVPELVIEVVSNREGDEAGSKMSTYARWGIPFYVIHDPFHVLGMQVLRVYSLIGGRYQPIAPEWVPELGLGFKLHAATYQGLEDSWLRYCDRDGNVLLTGDELAEQEKQRADKLAEKLRQAGIDPES